MSALVRATLAGMWPFKTKRAKREQLELERAQQLALTGDSGAMGHELRLLYGRTPPKRGSRELLEAYANLPWLHAIVKRRAEAFAGLQWVVFRAKPLRRARQLPGFRAAAATRHRHLADLVASGEVEQLHTHPLLDLLDQPNPMMTGRAMSELISKHQDLLGENFLGIDRTGGKPTGLWPLVPTWVQRTPTAEQPSYDVVTRSSRFTRAQEDMIWVKQHDPLNPYDGRGVGTAGALADELETDGYMAATAKARFFNRASPEAVLGINGIQKPALDQFARELEDKHRGVGRQGQMHIIGKDFRLQQLSHTMVESQYVEGRSLLRDFTLQVFGCPPEILGVLENANRSTIDAADLLFAKYSTVPQADRQRTELQAWVVPEYGERIWLDYVNPVPADKEANRKVMVALPAAFTVDEVRAAAGRPPLPAGKGEAMMVAPGAPRIPVETTPQDTTTEIATEA